MKFFNRILRSLLPVIAAASVFTGCRDEESDVVPGYGYVQFYLFKDASYTKAGQNELEFLADAAKLKVALRTNDNDIITPTVTVEASDKSLAEYGMQTDKFRLLAGDYTITSYQVLDALDNPVFMGEPAEETTISVVAGGLVTQDLTVNVTERGKVHFTLVKNSPEVKASGVDSYPFYMIMSADVTVRNTLTHEQTTFTNLAVEHRFVEREDGYMTAVCESDTLVTIKGGTYEVTKFVTYFDKKRKVKETCSNVEKNSFIVKDNAVAEASVPVTLDLTAGYIRDAIALKKIWEGLDGPNWKVKWNFDADVDIWTAQPGVQILEDGRIASLNFEDTGAHGPMPAAIGDLSELRMLILGTHSYYEGTSVTGKSQKYTEFTPESREELRESFTRTFVKNTDRYDCFSEEMRLGLKLRDIPLVENAEPLRTLPGPDHAVNYSNGITSLPAEINNLKKLQYLYAAYSPLTTLPEDMSGLESLTDVEMFYLPDITEFPKGFATLPKLQVITFACNYAVTEQSMYDGLVALNSSAAASSIQGLYLLNQKMDRIPDLRNCERMSVLNIQNCGVSAFEAPFGKKHYFVQFFANNNNLSSLPVDENGYFLGYDGNTEELIFSGNKFTSMPDIFEAKSPYSMGTVDFSNNLISSFDNYDGSGYRGVNCEVLNLAFNKLTEFPVEIAASNSALKYIQLQGNGIEKVSEDALKSDYINRITTIDLSYNKLTSLPDNFNSTTFPYLTGLDLSYNRFPAFPYAAVNNQYLTVFIFRHQRDAGGNRCMREWPTGIGGALYGLRALYLGSNDIRAVNDNLSYLIYNLDISDNPNISIDVSNICSYIGAGYFNLIYSPDQDIRGCDQYLKLNK